MRPIYLIINKLYFKLIIRASLTLNQQLVRFNYLQWLSIDFYYVDITKTTKRAFEIAKQYK